MERVVVEGIGKSFRIGFRKHQGFLARLIAIISGREDKKKVDVLKNVSFKCSSGEVLGLVGKNGSGKSTLLRIIAGIYQQDAGRVLLNGKAISIINLAVGLKERLTMKDNIYLCCSLFGMSRKEIARRFDSIVDFSELRDYTYTKLYQFSEGMKQRLAFSIAINCNPEILLLDEVFEVGDKSFKVKSARKIKELVSGGASVVLVSHDAEIIRRYCDRVILLEEGKIRFVGKALNGNMNI